MIRYDKNSVWHYKKNSASTEKPTHTNQYLQSNSHHPLHQNLGVVRTLLDRKDAIVTDEDDKKTEESNIKKALAQCVYPILSAVVYLNNSLKQWKEY